MLSLIKRNLQFLRDYYRSQRRKVSLEAKTIYGKLRRRIVRPPLPKLEDGAINLHLGCGAVNHPSFINIDELVAPHIHYVRSIDNLSPFKDNSVDLIYACHCLEHFSYIKVPDVLAGWFRVLKENGILRLSVPDFDLILNIYQENGNEINTIIGPLMGGQVDYIDFHKTVFNRASLEELLRSIGFRNIKEWQPNHRELTTFNDWSTRQILINGSYYSVSLNFEGTK